ncbi:uncharacterized protein FIBRA_04946 [Fibroporia radiculosa]|uniref:Uncharacterized protein n=1 Tax=Fibroporia radiculosa TaxID=599839 RepID=J4H385_9APHY|nr:uncharacterized protein FIBRA_04946 [Fibroporia radiculosa]CCM02834.1 predicted protein [Fibroporia radiculosa]
MATTPAPNPRASLLAGLRTGGVRSASGPTGNVPHTAAPAGAFNIPRIVSTPHNEMLYIQEEEADELPGMAHNLYIRNNTTHLQHPMTAAVDGAANRFAQQQAFGTNVGGGYPMTPAEAQSQLQNLQLRMMQMEIARLQARISSSLMSFSVTDMYAIQTIQAQQYQAELVAQAQRQRQQQQQQPARRSSVGFVPPATAGPAHTSFDLRVAAANAQTRRVNQADQLRAKLGVDDQAHLPMTAAIGGKFGSRMVSTRYDSDEDDFAPSSAKPPSTPNHTTVISGGTSLGYPSSNNVNGAAPSKSDAAVSWRRSAVNHSVLGGNRAASSPLVRITPPPGEPVSPTSGPGSAKARPLPLQLSAAASKPMSATVAVDDSDGTCVDDSSSVSSRSNSAPSTPDSDSTRDDPRLSPREEAVKKLYEGLGIGRAIPTITVAEPQDAPVVVQRSHPTRQPRGPPSNNDELLPKNFATRSRRKAIGALEALMDARERRDVEVF